MCGSAKRMCHAGVSAARSQCAYAVVHVATLFLFARGDECASESLGRAQQLLHPNPKGRHAPTAGRSHMHPHHHTSLFHRPSREGGLLRIPGLHCSAQSV